MLKNYIKIAFRNLLKNKSHTSINVGGLTLGMVCSIIIFLIIQYDLSFDKWHENSDRIYRVVRETNTSGKIGYDRGGPYPLASTIENEVTGIEHVSIIDNNNANDPVVTFYSKGRLEKKFKEENAAFVEQDYFNIFNYQWISGNPDNALVAPNSVVITESFAQKMFGSLDVIGKQLVLNTGSMYDLQITGLVKDFPETTDFPFTFLASSHSRNRNGNSRAMDSWNSNSSSLQTYLKLERGVHPEDINAQLKPLIAKYTDEDRVTEVKFFLQPLADFHFDSRFSTYSGRVVEKRILITLGIIGFLLLITACINFINLNTAIAVKRSKEVGLRKTLGGTKAELTFHFLAETALTTFLALVLSVGFTELLLRYTEPVLGFNPELNLLSNGAMLLFLGSLFVIVTLAAGWYPAQHLSGFSPIDAIRNKINSSYGKGITLRRSLTVVQFTITQILIIGTIVIATQIDFFLNKELGFEKNALVEIPIPDYSEQSVNSLRNLLSRESSVLNMSFSNTGAMNSNIWGGNYTFINDTVRTENNAQIKYVDEEFVDTYGLTILAGTSLAPSDTVNMYLINESLASQLGYHENYDQILGKPLSIWRREAPVVGVVKDFNTQSLHKGLSPVVISVNRRYHLVGIKINSSRIQEAIASIEKAYNQIFPDFVFEYSFLDDSIAEMYEDEQQTARIMNIFTVVAILIGCLGLFGLISYMAATRTKEIGVRKVLGADVLDILKIFANEFSVLTLISFAIAAPVSYYLMQQWLAEFAYKINLGFGIFGTALAGTLIIVILTVGYKCVKAALANPVESLKSE